MPANDHSTVSFADGPACGRQRGRSPLTRWFGLAAVGLCAWALGFGAGRQFFVPHVPGESPSSVVAASSLADVPFPPGAAAEYRAMLETGQQLVRGLLLSFPESAEAVSAAARLHDLAHHREGEIACWNRCLELDADYVAAYSRLGALALDSGRYEDAAQLMREGIKRHADVAEFHTVLAEALMNLGRLDEARQVLGDHLASHPDSVAGRFLLGHVCLRLEENEEAKRQFEAVVRMAPAHTNAYHGLATACTRLGRQKEADEHRQRFAALKQAEAQAQRAGLEQFVDERLAPQVVAQIATTAGRLYLAAGNAAWAETCLRWAAHLDATSVESRILLAELFDRQRRYRDALHLVCQLRALEPQNVTHHRNVGLLCARLGRFEMAEAAFENLCMLAPSSGLGFSALAELYLGVDRKLAEAKVLAEKAVRIEPAARHYAVLAAVCQKLGETAAAQAAIQEAIKLEPGNPRYRRVLEASGTSN